MIDNRSYSAYTPPQRIETQPTPERTLKSTQVFQALFDVPDSTENPDDTSIEKSNLEKQHGISGELVRKNISDRPEVPNEFTTNQEIVIRRTAQDLRMHDFKNEQDFETPLEGDFEVIVIPAGRNGADSRANYALEALENGKAKLTGIFVLAGSMEREFKPDKEGKESPELAYFRDTYSEAFEKLMAEKGPDYIPTEYDLVSAQAESLREEYPDLIIADVGVTKLEGDQGVHTYTIAKKVLDFIVENFYGGNETLLKGVDIAFVTNQIYQASTGSDMRRAAKERGIDDVFVAGLPAEKEASNKRSLTAYFKEILTAITTAGKAVAAEKQR
jgi:hypothetical protein